MVICPALCESLQRQAERGEIQVIEREYRPRDLEGARLVIAATDDQATNEAVWREAESLGCLANVVDDPAHCNFHAPATVRRGDLCIAVSTGGNSPALAKRLRRTLEAQFDDSYEPFLALLGELRPLVKERIVDPAIRLDTWEALLGSDILELFRDGAHQAAQRCALEIIDVFIQ